MLPAKEHACPACGALGMRVFYEARGLPANSMLLLRDKKEALEATRGDLSLGFCDACGFISNTAFEPAKTEYSSDYESSQAYSETFNAFARQLARELAERYQLRDKTIVEIGSGGSDFLALLCEQGVGRAVGIDPAATMGPQHDGVKDRITLINDFYAESHGEIEADLVLCRMTLEHIWKVGEFVSTVRRAASRRGVPVVFQVPDASRILTDAAFWDVYYEHCSYFTPESLRALFEGCGFAVDEAVRAYDDQYIVLHARPAGEACEGGRIGRSYVAGLREAVSDFARRCEDRIEEWRQRVQVEAERGRRAVIWGGGSKGVAFLNTLGLAGEIDYVVDINPLKQDKYAAGAGHLIVGPQHLRERQPDLIIVMNSVYEREIREMAESMGVQAEVVSV
jgi:hypothetical protein